MYGSVESTAVAFDAPSPTHSHRWLGNHFHVLKSAVFGVFLVLNLALLSEVWTQTNQIVRALHEHTMITSSSSSSVGAIQPFPSPMSMSISSQVALPNLRLQEQEPGRGLPAKSNAPKVLVVYSEETATHLSRLAQAVEQGVLSVVDSADKKLRVRTVANVSFEDDVVWADAVILGAQVINANVDPKMITFISGWKLDVDLSHKVGAAFVTGGGISAGQELTMVNLLHSMMIFRMVIVGGERWTSAFGASAITHEAPFGAAPRSQSPRNQNTSSSHPSSSQNAPLFPSNCYVQRQDDPDTLHKLFKDKAYGLGKRVATIARKLAETCVQPASDASS